MGLVAAQAVAANPVKEVGRMVKSLIRKKGQVTLTKELLDQIGAHENDEILWEVIDGKLVGTPYVSVSVPKHQAWYYSEKWQVAESEIDQWVDAGGLETTQIYNTAEDAISALDRLKKK
jgi:hypothetical protein